MTNVSIQLSPFCRHMFDGVDDIASITCLRNICALRKKSVEALAAQATAAATSIEENCSSECAALYNALDANPLRRHGFGSSCFSG